MTAVLNSPAHHYFHVKNERLYVSFLRINWNITKQPKQCVTTFCSGMLMLTWKKTRSDLLRRAKKHVSVKKSMWALSPNILTGENKNWWICKSNQWSQQRTSEKHAKKNLRRQKKTKYTSREWIIGHRWTHCNNKWCNKMNHDSLKCRLQTPFE